MAWTPSQPLAHRHRIPGLSHGFCSSPLHIRHRFLAELGDKTQLATVAISGTSDRPLAVFLGSSSALVVASLLGALAGGSVATVIPSDLLQLVASIDFLVIGFRLLWPLLANQAKEPDETDPSNS